MVKDRSMSTQIWPKGLARVLLLWRGSARSPSPMRSVRTRASLLGSPDVERRAEHVSPNISSVVQMSSASQVVEKRLTNSAAAVLHWYFAAVVLDWYVAPVLH